MSTVIQRVRVIARSRNGLRSRQRGLLRLGFPVRFFLEQRDLTGEDIESLLLRLRDERTLVDRKFRVVDERVRQVVVLRPQVLFLLLDMRRDEMSTCRLTTACTRFRTFLVFFSPPPSVPAPDSGAPSPSLSLSYRFAARGGVAGRCPVALASEATSTS